MSGLSVKCDDRSLIHLKQNHWIGWVFAIVGAGLCYLPHVKTDIGGQSWIVYVVGGMFALIGVLAALYRIDVQLDLRQRRYRVTKGFWPNPACHQGAFEQLEGLRFSKRWRTSSGENKTRSLFWQTGLKLPDNKGVITLFESGDECAGREYFEKRAKQLRIKTIDCTGEQPVEKNWDQLDQSVKRQLDQKTFDAVNEVSPPTGLTYENRVGAAVYWTSKRGVNAGSVMGVIFGLPFFVLGLLSLVIGLGLHENLGWDVETSGSMTAAIVVGALFTALGAFILKISIDYGIVRYRIEISETDFRYDTYIFGRARKKQRMRVSQIEDLDVRDSTANKGANSIAVGGATARRYHKNKRELFVRSDSHILKIRHLDERAAYFLRNVFYQRISSRWHASDSRV